MKYTARTAAKTRKTENRRNEVSLYPHSACLRISSSEESLLTDFYYSLSLLEFMNLYSATDRSNPLICL